MDIGATKQQGNVPLRHLVILRVLNALTRRWRIRYRYIFNSSGLT